MTHRPACIIVSSLVALLAAASAPVPALTLTKAQQRCVNSYNGDLQRLSAALDGEVLACARDYVKGKHGVTDVTACAASDRKGKIAKASQHLTDDTLKYCTGTDRNGEPKDPGVYVTGHNALAAYVKQQGLFRDLFGTGANGTLTTVTSDKEAAACQLAVSMRVRSCQDVKVKAFLKCAKTALANGASDAAALEACILADPKGLIAKACDLSAKADPIRMAVEKKCAGTIAATAFPQCPLATADGVHDCLETPVECIVCKTINLADDLAADCDQLDDGVVNESCSLCGDSIIDPGEVCDVNNLNGQTCESLGFPGGGGLGCTSSCSFDTSHCLACSVVLCPGYGQPNDNVTCQNGQTCTFSCQGENYDIDDDPSNGCEVSDSPQGNHTISSPAPVSGSFSACDDGTEHPLFSGALPSDTRAHQQPAIVGFDTSTGSAPDWLTITPTTGTFCYNDLVVTLTMTSSTNPSCYKLIVITDKFSYSCQTSSGGSCTINQDTGGQFSDGQSILFEVQKVCGTNTIENAAYTVSGHF
jgi:hypothetical protein